MVDRLPNLRWFLVAALAAAIVIAGAHPAFGASSNANFNASANGNGNGNGNGNASKFARGHILVAPQENVSAADYSAALTGNSGHSLGKLPNLDIDVVDVPAGKEEETVAKLQKHKHVKFAEVDRQMDATFIVDDPNYASAWHLATIGAPTAWDYTMGSGVIIAILDSGVDGTHPDLVSQLVPGYNFYDNNAITTDVSGHGTAIAGIAAAASNNSVGVASVAGYARIMPLRITDASGYGYWSAAASALTWAADRGARVANISYQGASASSTIQSAASYFRSKGGVVFAASGNTGAIDNTAPTSLISVVSATDSADQLASWSTYGSFVDLAAPGVGIWTTVNGGGYGAVSGTSASTPVAAGVAALVIARRPDFTASQVDSTIRSTVVDLGAAGSDIYFGAGRVNAAGALQLAAGSVPSSDTTPPTVAITSPTGGTVSGVVSVGVNASDNVGVTRVDFRVNGTTLATVATAPYLFSWDSTSVANGTYSATAVAYDAAGNSKISSPVALTVANAVAPPPSGDTTPPVVAFTAPANGSVVSGTVLTYINASDDVGVVKVDLYINGNLHGSSSGGNPYGFAWGSTSFAAGTSVQLVAKAYDAAGNVGTSSITVSVQSAAPPPPSDTTPPTVAIASPTGGTVTGTIAVSVNASDNVGVARVDLRVNGATVATSNSAPYQFSWNSASAADGMASLTAVAYDAAGNSAVSSAVSINVQNAATTAPDTTPPVVTITNPVNGSMIATNGNVSIKASATDNSGSTGISQKVYIDGVLKATVSGATLTYTWNSRKSAPGTHTISVTATDANGNTATQQVQVTKK